jgi:hypothetical protein
MAEVAGHAHPRAPLALLTRPEPAAADQQRDQQQPQRSPHGTSTRSAKERTRPAFVATAE